MSTQSYSLTYSGYWREPNKASIPNESGVYTVYAATYNRDDTVTLHRVLYIGESAAVRDRIANHEKTDAWKRQLRVGEILCFNFAPVGSGSRVRVEAALINHHKPPVNTEYVSSFPFDTTTIATSGRNALLDTRFTVRGSRAAAW